MKHNKFQKLKATKVLKSPLNANSSRLQLGQCYLESNLILCRLRTLRSSEVLYLLTATAAAPSTAPGRASSQGRLWTERCRPLPAQAGLGPLSCPSAGDTLCSSMTSRKCL